LATAWLATKAGACTAPRAAGVRICAMDQVAEGKVVLYHGGKEAVAMVQSTDRKLVSGTCNP